MNKEDKSLLLQDLCARLPYKVKVQTPVMNDEITLTCGDISAYFFNPNNKVFLKPYLRPLSSMTEEEKEELKEISRNYLDEWENTKTSLERWKLDAKESYKRAVFYNSHHFDWNDLIPKGLAIAVTEENNPYKE